MMKSLLALGGLAGLALAQHALADDKLMLNATLARSVDSNIFRLPAGIDAEQFIGSAEQGDNITALSAGARLDLPYARQRVTANLKATRTSFARFSDLDYTGYDGQADWLWQFGNDWSGDLGWASTRTLASFNSSQERLRNIVSTPTLKARVSWQFAPGWLLEFAPQRGENRNSAEARKVNDYRALDREIGFKYLSAANTVLGLSARTNDYRFPTPQQVAGTPIDNGYRIRTLALAFDWRPTGSSRLSGYVGRQRYLYRQLSDSDFSGGYGRLVYDWNGGGVGVFNLSLRRDVSSYQRRSTFDVSANHVLTRGVSITPSLLLSSKLRAQLNADYARQDYRGGVSAFQPAQERQDRVFSTGAGLSYQPRRELQFDLQYQRETRRSNQPLTDYSARVWTASLQLNF